MLPRKLVAFIVIARASAEFGTIRVDWDSAGPHVAVDAMDDDADDGDASCTKLPLPHDDDTWDRLEGAVLGALMADSLALRDHYEYSLDRTLRRGIISTLSDPADDNLTPVCAPWLSAIGPTRVSFWLSLPCDPACTGLERWACKIPSSSAFGRAHGLWREHSVVRLSTTVGHAAPARRAACASARHGVTTLVHAWFVASHRALRSAVSQRTLSHGADAPGAPFSGQVYYHHWVEAMETHDGYKCMAARAAWQSGLGADGGRTLQFMDMPGPARAAALLPAFRAADELTLAARAVCGISHGADGCDAAALLVAVPHCAIQTGHSLRRVLAGALGSAEGAPTATACKSLHALLAASPFVTGLAVAGYVAHGNVVGAHGVWQRGSSGEADGSAKRADPSTSDDGDGARAASPAVTVDDLRRDDRAIAELTLPGDQAQRLGGMAKASPIGRALPEAIYLVLRYEHDVRAAFVANAMLGGDSAARAALIGSWLGAHHGSRALPAEWSGKNLAVAQEAKALIAALRREACAEEEAEEEDDDEGAEF